MGSTSKSLNNMLVIGKPCKSGPLFTGNQSVPFSVILEDPLAVLVQLYARQQQAKDDVRELTQAIPMADAIVVNINDIQNNYDMLINEPYSLFVELSKDPSAFCRFSEIRFCSIITKFQTAGPVIWTMISGLWDNLSGKKEAVEIQLDRLNGDG
jgi:hypothetical protein